MKIEKIMPPTWLLIALIAMLILHFLLPIAKIIPTIWNLTGFVFLVSGITLNLIADRAFQRIGTTVKPYQESSNLVTSGVFKIRAMAPKTKEQYAKIREDRREEILNTALELFARQGVTHTTMQDIARAAGISKGLIYNYFTSKEDLLHELMASFIRHLHDYFDPDGDGILTEEEMKYFIEKQVDSLKQNVAYYKFLYMLMIPNW